MENKNMNAKKTNLDCLELIKKEQRKQRRLDLKLLKAIKHYRRHYSNRDHYYNNALKEFIIKLIEKGADVNARDIDGNTPLHWAANFGNVESINLLLKAGADVKKQYLLY